MKTRKYAAPAVKGLIVDQIQSLSVKENLTIFGLITHSAGTSLLRRDIKSISHHTWHIAGKRDLV